MIRTYARRTVFAVFALVLLAGAGYLADRFRDEPTPTRTSGAMTVPIDPIPPEPATAPMLRPGSDARDADHPPVDHNETAAPEDFHQAKGGDATSDAVMVGKFNNDAIGAGGGGGGGRFGARMGGGGAREPMPAGTYHDVGESGFVKVTDTPESTVALETHTASYSVVRQQIETGHLPAKEMVRLEELVNSFRYAYRQPVDGAPFAVDVEVVSCPWEPTHRIARVGLATAPPPAADQRVPANLVLLIDVSGSMSPSQRLPLILDGLRAMIPNLGPRDRVAIVVYAGAAGLVLPSTPATDVATITGALDKLHAGGSTAGAQGLVLAYQEALANFIPGGINRVILCTDGDFNVGVTGTDAIIALALEYVAKKVFLTVLGVGDGGRFNDAMLEAISNRCDGHYAFLDTAGEARRVLVEQLTGTLLTVAKDVKLQVAFDPARVESYRLLGYENRRLANKDFADDKKDAGEIGAGHTATALYQLIPVAGAHDAAAPILRARLRYKLPASDTSTLLEVPVADPGTAYAQATGETQLALAIAEFALALRGSELTKNASLDAAHELAKAAVTRFEDGRPPADLAQREALVRLIERAKGLAAAK